MAKRKGRDFFADSLQVLSGQVAMMAIGIVNSIITARWLGPADRGRFALLVLLPTMLSNLIKLGIPQASVYYIRRRGASPSDVASNSVWFAFVTGTIAALVCYLLRNWLIANFLKDTSPMLITASAALIPFVTLQFYFLGVAQAQERFRDYNVWQVGPNLLALIGLLITVVMLHMGLTGAVMVQFAIQVFMTVWMAWRVHRAAPLRARWNGELARGMLVFGRKSYVQTLAATLHLRIDQYICSHFLPMTEVGLYAQAVMIAGLLLKIPEATGTVMFPRLAGSSDADAHVTTTRVCRSTLFVLALGSLATGIAAPIVIPYLYSSRFAGSVRPLLILLPGLLMMALYQLLTRNFTSRNKQGINIFAACAALALNVTLNIFLVPRFGISGAALANGLSYGTAALVLLVAFIRDSGHSVGETLIVRPTEIGDLARAARRMAARVQGRKAA